MHFKEKHNIPFPLIFLVTLLWNSDNVIYIYIYLYIVTSSKQFGYWVQ